MADAAAARREARRRKILENSDNRLQLISGKYGQASTKESPIRTVIPNDNFEIPVAASSSSFLKNTINNGIVATEPETFNSTSYDDTNDAAGDGLAAVASDLAAFMSPASEPTSVQPVSLWEKVILYKYDVVIVSFLVQLLYSWSLLSFDGTYFFLPLVVYVVTKIIWFPTQSSSSFANALLLLNGISLDRVQKIMSATHVVSTFSQDVCVFLFTTICTQALFTVFKDKYAT